MTLRETRDVALIDRVLNDPAVYPWISDDGSPPRGQYTCAGALPELVLRVDLDELAGVFGFFATDGGRGGEMHTSLLPNCRGRMAIAAGRAAVAHFFAQGKDLLRSFHLVEEPQTGWYARQLGFLPDGGPVLLPRTRAGRPITKCGVILPRARWREFCI